MHSSLCIRELSKSFPGVRALGGVDLDIPAGQVHALLGENGAGKSTLLKILGGELRPDGGSLQLAGQALQFKSAADALNQGIAVIHQELQYIPEMTVLENLWLGRLPQRWGFVRFAEARAQMRTQLARIGIALDLDARMIELSIGQRQMVEICKAVLRDARVIALDEPTSSLSHSETETLFRLVRELREQGKVLIYVSHRLDEIFALCDGASVLRDGRSVGRFASLQGVSRDQLVQAMVGREIQDVFGSGRKKQAAAANETAARSPRLQVQQLSGRSLPEPASFEVAAGEIVGFFGLMGAGRSELMRLVFGADPRRSGQVWLDGELMRSDSVAGSIAAGLMFCPEDRKEQGIIGCRSVAENINLSCRRNNSGLLLNAKREAEVAAEFIARLRIKTPSPAQEIRLLSGGNQQKAILARWLAERELKVLIIDEPTRGIDIGAKSEIYEVLHELAARGVAIVVVSSELPEVLGLADRVLVMRQGRIAGSLARGEANEARVLALALPDGGARQEAQAA
ncbi:L-arabinose ABC transporter ATP-binding protein AraG [Paucibacter sp. DJ2R-2]|uniref:L-arabinose ABC transporter ATP-binding protein AraG n=1 Tax=Paucibacter sp. DJ2R-2 TaxID=2893558 RepID=UPI0021E50F9F|nr:L-arabinose ABC transporter ATP-binding protein AraG [Paucibacter sp. DJ2R-2]MCV2422530.1 L-arabinose ABC transporter ATP-binding protein AraG [Paucibacter sp. DJ4R-1]MCV2438728.1 L-arabinose ABC transporter ATP-binding protein AraG [Paucibacter sp. DJ2R-2]